MDWISVDERLPESDALVNIVKGGSATSGFFDGMWWDINGRRGGDVTHWQPIPEPPKEQGPFSIGGVSCNARRQCFLKFRGGAVSDRILDENEAQRLVVVLNDLWIANESRRF